MKQDNNLINYFQHMQQLTKHSLTCTLFHRHSILGHASKESYQTTFGELLQHHFYRRPSYHQNNTVKANEGRVTVPTVTTVISNNLVPENFYPKMHEKIMPVI